MSKYKEYKQLDLPKVADEILDFWEKDKIFDQSISSREGNEPFVFYEGPPSANGLPGIHHVMARAIKDIFCRYKTQKGFQVKRKAGWDTHGLPVELGVEKELGITKEDIGKTISVEEYNQKCREAVMRYTDVWNNLTQKMGYWVDMDDPYVTYENKYIETVWYLLKKLYDKGLIYKGYTIQPYSPAAGTGLSTHELNQPGCYRDVKDTSATAMFKVVKNEDSDFLFKDLQGDLFFIAWTTTPWTLPSNTALGVGGKIDYVKVKTFNKYTHEPITVVLAKELLGKWFNTKNADLPLNNYKEDGKNIPYEIVDEFKGSRLEGLRYEQLLPYKQPEEGDAFRVILGDFVTTEDGTGIVHLAPSYGADDFRVTKANGIGALHLVDNQGRFTEEVTDFAGMYVKNAYYDEGKAPEKSVDVEISIKLKEENRAFDVQKYEHSYPHCWRTDKPVLYFPLDSWFIKTTAVKDKLIANNNTINWKPESTGKGRFGNWLENLQDWNLSRSRYWGIPIPIWTTEDREEQICIGSAEQLKAECEKAVEKGLMDKNPLADFEPGNMDEDNYHTFDFHRPFVDEIILVSPSGKPMKREMDLIDVWFDSGSMPYAQWHYPFENKELIDENKFYPADFIAEGVDQTRGWFFTLHAIATLCFDSVAYKNVVSNGLVLDKNGQKMSKRLGNAVDPFETLKKYGPDATRWYMVTNAQPWDNLKFDEEGIVEVQRKFFGTLYNTYNFFALYANIDGFKFQEEEIPFEERPEIDRWILSKLNSLIKTVDAAFADYEPTKAGRAIQEFTTDHLSNWYVRLCRRRFWKGDYTQDKISAYQTLYTCLETLAKLSAPIAPFFMDRLYQDLNKVSGRETSTSVHLADFGKLNESNIDVDLEERMEIAQKLSSMVLALRKKESIRVRQPLQKMMVPILDPTFKRQLEDVEDLILSEVNVKELEYLEETAGVLVKKIKPDFKKLGPKFGKEMKQVAAAVNQMSQEQIAELEANESIELALQDNTIQLELSDVEISSEDIPGWLVSSEGKYTVALDITLSDALKNEGIAREIVNRIQNFRKEAGFEVTDKIVLKIESQEQINDAINHNKDYICSETLTSSLEIVEKVDEQSHELEIDTDVKTKLSLQLA
ncbi:MAG: isoleucine--tRNA ligase [Flavobacteriales bacterium]|nr:isoleucine--tRNA ligase [Flavobacteriales bacterium]|tara:strand:+ start:67758 stop:71117 length:3360 start_codon:yes stop_codon:yes gene_type:complete